MNTQQPISIIHISDTHGMHQSILNMRSADILIHTGDWTNNGLDEEHTSFNNWLGDIKHKFKYIVLITGNNEYKNDLMHSSLIDPKKYLSDKLTNATHILEHESVELCGLHIFGSAWLPGAIGSPDIIHTKDNTTFKMDRFNEIPTGCDILLTHGPPLGVFDMCGSLRSWGSSIALTQAVMRAKPQVHLFGHVHEQRGVWRRQNKKWVGGVEYVSEPGVIHPTWAPPIDYYPGQIISSNAMKNNPRIDHMPPHLVGNGRLIVAIPIPATACMDYGHKKTTINTSHSKWKFVVGTDAILALK